MTTETELKKMEGNIRKMYLLKTVSGMFFFIPVIVLFWQDNGLNLTQIMLLQSLFSLAVVVLEVPSGYFADVFGRKNSLLIASIVLVLAVFTYSLGHSFSQFLCAEMFFAVGLAFISGCDSALISETLMELKREADYQEVFGKARFYNNMAVALASIVGGFVGVINLRWTFYLMLPFLVWAVYVTHSISEPNRQDGVAKKGYPRELFTILKTCLVDRKKLRWIILYSGIVFSFNQAGLWFYQPYFQLSGLDIAFFGMVFASFQIAAALSSKYACKWEKAMGSRFSLILLVVLVGTSYLLMSNVVFLFSFSFIFFQQFVRGFSKVVVTDYLNRLTVSNGRATILSLESLIGRLLYAAIIPGVGWIADVYSLVQALSVLGISTLLAGTGVLILLCKSRAI